MAAGENQTVVREMGARHPEHDAIAETVRGWYVNPYPAMVPPKSRG